MRALGIAVVILAALGGVFVLLYATATHTYTGDSDGATVVLEGAAMAHGHLLLGGWAISLDSFWTVDALWYLVATLVGGITPALLYGIPAAIACAVIAVGVLLACDGRRRAAGIAVAAGTVVGVLAFPSHALADFFLRGPLHVGTTLWCLVAFGALRRGRFGWGFAVAVVMLAAGMLGDLQMLALGVVPVALAGVAASARTRRWRAGVPLVSAAVASVVLAEVVRTVARLIGTFSIAAANPIATLPMMVRNLKHGLHETVLMLGVGSGYYGLGGEPTALSYTHLLAVGVVGLALVAAALALLHGVVAGRPTVAGGRQQTAGGAGAGATDTKGGEPWRLDDLLVLATVASPLAFSVLAVTGDPQYARYLTSGIIFGAVLAGRVGGRVAERLADRGRPSVALRAAAAVGVAAICCYSAGTATLLEQPVPRANAVSLARFLEEHHLDRGYGAYWSASITTVASHGTVEVRPVVCPHGVIVRYLRNSAASWYGPREEATFLVYEPGAPWGSVDSATAIHTFGPPERSYTVSRVYRVLVWSHPLRLPHR